MPPVSMPARAARAVAWLVNRRRGPGPGLGGALWNASLSGARRFAGHAWAVVRQLSLQIVGAVFLFFAAGFAYHGILEWRRFERSGGNHSLALTETVLAVLFAYFGVSSFFRAGQFVGRK